MAITPIADGDVYYEEEANTPLALASANAKMLLNVQRVDPSVFFPNQMYADSFRDTTYISSATNFDNPVSDTPLQYKFFLDQTTATATFTSKVLGKNEINISKGVLVVDYDVYNLLDSCSDSSVGAGWTTAVANGGTVTEDTTGLLIDNPRTSGVTSAEAYWTTNNFYQTYDEVRIMTQEDLDYWSSGLTIYYRYQVTDGSTTVTLKTSSRQGVQTGYADFRVKFNGTNDNCLWSWNGSDWATADLSSLTSNWYFKVTVDSSSSSNISGSMKVYYLSRRAGVSTVTSTCTPSVRVDGVNWESVSDGKIHNLVNAGDEPEVKLEFVKASEEVIVLNGYTFTVFK